MAFEELKELLGALPPDRAESFKQDLLEYLEEERTEDGLDVERLYRLIVGTRKG